MIFAANSYAFAIVISMNAHFSINLYTCFFFDLTRRLHLILTRSVCSNYVVFLLKMYERSNSLLMCVALTLSDFYFYILRLTSFHV